ncbi:MAG: hypothetical protein GC201_16625 [Alphaproteobacteria bacterium]|nr:hypothetical protein [Alphaproteobacteria bacterium]
MPIPFSPILALVLMALSAGPALADDVVAHVTDSQGAPLADAVVTLTPDTLPPLGPPADAIVDQVNLQFVPYVTVIRAGATVTFPNSDKVRHHVYSFSPAKTFELPLYPSGSSPSLQFDKPGVVPLGCNIHDWMLAYIYVSATPYFAKTGGDGRATLAAVPGGTYAARVWHPRLVGTEAATTRRVEIGAATGELQWVLKLKPEFRIPRRRMEGGPGY